MDIYNEKNLEIVQKLNMEEEINCDFIIICISDMICLFSQVDKFKNGIFSSIGISEASFIYTSQ